MKRRAGYDILRRLCAVVELWPGSPSDLLTAVLELQLELPPLERGDHAAELFPGKAPAGEAAAPAKKPAAKKPEAQKPAAQNPSAKKAGKA